MIDVNPGLGSEPSAEPEDRTLPYLLWSTPALEKVWRELRRLEAPLEGVAPRIDRQVRVARLRNIERELILRGVPAGERGDQADNE